MKKQIDFDFSKWGQEGISVIAWDELVLALHQHPTKKYMYYGICENGCVIGSAQDLKMYQEIKPREIWVNEYSCGFGTMHFTEKTAIQNIDKARTFVRLVKFREVFDDEQ